MTKAKFIELIELYKPVISGRGREVARLAGVSYTTYQNYVKGMASDKKTMLAIITACENVSKGLTKAIRQIPVMVVR